MTQKNKKTVRIKRDRCKGCDLCIHVCPQNILERSKSVSQKGLHYVVLKDAEKCTGCGMCVLMCPDVAIEMVYSE